MNDTQDLHSRRPLSPHLQIYKPQMTSTLSIFHRICGVSMIFGTLLLAWLLVAAATGEDAFNQFSWFVQTPVGLLMLFGWSFALYYHMCNGVRHLIWDMGFLFKIENAKRGGWAVLVVSALLTGATWFCAYGGF